MHWPAGNNKPGQPSTDYIDKVNLCMDLLLHAPITAVVDGELTIIPMRPLPASQEWNEVISFDPLSHFSDLNVIAFDSLKGMK